MKSGANASVVSSPSLEKIAIRIYLNILVESYLGISLDSKIVFRYSFQHIFHISSVLF